MTQSSIILICLSWIILSIGIFAAILIIFRMMSIPIFFTSKKNQHYKKRVRIVYNNAINKKINKYLNKKRYYKTKNDNYILWKKTPFNSKISLYIKIKYDDNNYYLDAWWKIDLPYLSKYDYPLNFPIIVTPTYYFKKDVKKIESIIVVNGQ